MRIALLPLALALAVAACAPLTATPIVFDDSPNGGGTTSNQLPLPTDDFAPVRRGPPCPVERPLDNTFCSAATTVCEYPSGVFGTTESIDSRCNTIVKCIDNAWTTQREGQCPLDACPKTRADLVEGGPCTLPAGINVELLCDYPEGACGCTEGTGTGVKHALTWVCIPPQTACGDHRPRVGQSCVDASPCEYGACVFANGVRMFCESSVWTVGESTCN